ncbi:guanylate kinase [Limosilactobacillus sp. WILCCON 0052]
MMDQQHKVFVITGAAGTGKTTVADYLRKKYDMAKVITHTTRLPRANEKDGVDYYFETRSSMQKRYLLEQVEYDHHLYGSSIEGLKNGWRHHQFDVIVLDTKGALTYRAKLGDQVVVIFLTVSHPQQLFERLHIRGDHPAAIESRINSCEYQRDLSLPQELKGQAIELVNDDWSMTKQKLDQLLSRYI